MDVWVELGTFETHDGGRIATWGGAVYSSADLGWQGIHEGYGRVPDNHERLETETNVWCRGCDAELQRVTIDG